MCLKLNTSQYNNSKFTKINRLHKQKNACTCSYCSLCISLMFQFFAVITENIDIATFIHSEVYSASLCCNYIRYSRNVNHGLITSSMLILRLPSFFVPMGGGGYHPPLDLEFDFKYRIV